MASTGHTAYLPICNCTYRSWREYCMKWALCQSNLHPSMSHNLDGAMNAACHVMHAFALHACIFWASCMSCMSSILAMHACYGDDACHACTLPCVPCVQHMHACLNHMHDAWLVYCRLCSPHQDMHVYASTPYHACMRVMHAHVFTLGSWQFGDKTNSAPLSIWSCIHILTKMSVACMHAY